jgi:hypothetical protein
MLVTAFIDEAAREAFNVWHRDEHFPRVLSIPGIVRGVRLQNPPAAPNYAAVYVFQDEAAVRVAFSSPEAEQARADWGRWRDSVRDLTVQIYAEYTASRPYFRHN